MADIWETKIWDLENNPDFEDELRGVVRRGRWHVAEIKSLGKRSWFRWLLRECGKAAVEDTRIRPFLPPEALQEEDPIQRWMIMLQLMSSAFTDTPIHPPVPYPRIEKLWRATLTLCNQLLGFVQSAEKASGTAGPEAGIIELAGMKLDTIRHRVKIDDHEYYDLKDDEYKIWKIVWDADGKYVTGATIGERAAQIKHGLPQYIKNEIETHTRQGYRMKRFIPRS